MLNGDLMRHQSLDEYQCKRFAMPLPEFGLASLFAPRQDTYIESRRVHIEYIQAKAHSNAMLGRLVGETLIRFFAPSKVKRPVLHRESVSDPMRERFTYPEMMIHDQDARAVCPTLGQLGDPALCVYYVDSVRLDLVSGGERV